MTVSGPYRRRNGFSPREGAERRYELGASSDFTEAALFRLGFKWPVSGEKYIESMLKALDELDMFSGQ